MSEGTLLDQWRLAFACACDPRLSRGDVAVLMAIEDRFYKSKGNSRASLDLLADKAGIARRNVIVSLKKLRSLGYLEVLSKGRRGRATEYLPNFKFGCVPEDAHNQSEKYGDSDVTLTDEKYGGAGITLNAEKGDAGITKSDEYSDASITPTYLREPADKPGGRVSRTSDEEGARGAASPPPPSAGGAVADTPRDPVVGFEELWSVWLSRYQRPKAKAAYLKLNPDAALHAQLVAAAQEWTEHYRSNHVEKKWIPLLHNWIQGERWLEDVPAVYEDPKTAAIANKRGRKAKAKAKAKAKGNGCVPYGNYNARIVTSEMRNDGKDNQYALIEFEILDDEHKGRKVFEEIKIGSVYSSEERYIGMLAITALRDLVANRDLKDTSQLLGIDVRLEVTEDGLSYERALNPRSGR